ncbi:hypothetical protein R3P38DRAFT_3020729 [Favolaschia claudopus]|uniref:Uncharacterized protein n=1 Tax=Favolaschia claudopus TaxID=2862362 RepID=A0AAW0AHX8_9AGAR
MDFLRNRDVGAILGPFDGNVAATSKLGAEECFITTNTNYVPSTPSLQQPHALFLRPDMRYGTDDPTLWPQQWTSHFCHLPAIAKKGAWPELAAMWWDPTRDDFVVGSAVTRGLGRLSCKQFSKLLTVVNAVVARAREFMKQTSANLSPLFGQLIQSIVMRLEQLQSLPTTYPKMVFGVTSLQREVLELDALHRYTTIYKPRMDGYTSNIPSDVTIEQCIGAFTSDPSVAQQLWAARLPFWFIRPTFVFDSENILAVVPLRNAAFDVSPVRGDGAPPIVYSANSTVEKIQAIHRAAIQTPWYRDPFETGFKSSALPSSAPCQRATTIETRFNETGMRSSRMDTEKKRFKPYPCKSNAPTGKGTSKIERDKFEVSTAEGMPARIASWTEALRRVDRTIEPLTIEAADRRYVLPEPALLVNPSPDRQRIFLTHWKAVADGFFYLLGNPAHTQLLSGQEWRDVLVGLMTERGAGGSRTNKRSAGLEGRLHPALEASNVTTLEGFPIPLEKCRQFSLKETREIVWEVAETSFRFEFCALDRRASKKDRLEEVKDCFPGRVMLGVPLQMSQRGFAADLEEERHNYIKKVARLMLDWTARSQRPEIIGCLVGSERRLSSSEMAELESAVCNYYTQAFWEYFGRAAVVPMRLDHTISEV